MSIREHIINNFKNDDYATLKSAITESIDSKDEITLPGLGVFFSLMWESSDQELKNKVLELIHSNIKRGPSI